MSRLITQSGRRTMGDGGGGATATAAWSTGLFIGVGLADAACAVCSSVGLGAMVKRWARQPASDRKLVSSGVMDTVVGVAVVVAVAVTVVAVGPLRALRALCDESTEPARPLRVPLTAMAAAEVDARAGGDEPRRSGATSSSSSASGPDRDGRTTPPRLAGSSAVATACGG